MKFRILFLSLGILTAVDAQTISVKQYIDSFKNVAMREMVEFKIPASITLAQGLLESGSGNSRLAKQGNNHFGIKCKKEWTGCTILEDDDALQECFRCYGKAEDSYKDHSKFLKENRRYAALFTLEINDYKAWAKGLLAAGYATNQKYADLIISTIERNRLQQFDSMVLHGYDPYKTELKANIDIVYNKVPSTIVGENQKLEEIAVANQKSSKKISKYNDLEYHHQIEPGDVLYLRPKKRKASVASHQVQNGETMWEISQIYAIRISALYKKNLMEPGTEPKPGVILHLQDKASSRPDTGRIVKEIQPNPAVQKSLIHVVVKGETLYSIAKKYGLSVNDLKSMNNLSSDQLQLGQELEIKNGVKASETVSSTIYIVEAGDTLYSIALRHKVKVEDIKSWNHLNSDQLSVGQRLEIR